MNAKRLEIKLNERPRKRHNYEAPIFGKNQLLFNQKVAFVAGILAGSFSYYIDNLLIFFFSSRMELLLCNLMFKPSHQMTNPLHPQDLARYTP